MNPFNASSSRRHFLMALPVLLILACNSRSAAQVISGTISGTVTDSSGAAIAGASVSLLNEGTKAVREDLSDQTGGFSFTAIQPGEYTLRVSASGFRTVERTRNVLLANSTLQLEPIALTLHQGAKAFAHSSHSGGNGRGGPFETGA